MRPEKIKASDVYKMRSTLKSFMREWSTEGATERQSAYLPIIEEVDAYFAEQGRQPFDLQSGDRVSVLNPGCGLGRLVFEFAAKGYRSQGNEFAYFMLLPSNFILNQTESVE
jgi:carnosine N-methyltransferase